MYEDAVSLEDLLNNYYITKNNDDVAMRAIVKEIIELKKEVEDLKEDLKRSKISMRARFSPIC